MARIDWLGVDRTNVSYGIAIEVVRLLVRLFFRRIVVVGTEHLPSDGGGLLVAWHPNGLVDPALLLAHTPRRVVFGARHGLFQVPLLGALMRAIGTVPIYRAQDAPDAAGDAAERRRRNEASLDVLAHEIAAGSFSALFPEGKSHDAPHLLELKTGSARLVQRAHALCASESTAHGASPVVVPVGLHYDKKSVYRSEALVVFHPSIALVGDLAPAPAGADADEVTRRARMLTDAIEQALHQAVHATESWEVNGVMHTTRKLLRAERARRAGTTLEAPDIQERERAFARVWTGYERRRREDPSGTAALFARVRAYGADLRALGVEDDELDRAPSFGARWLVAIVLAQLVLVYFLLPPLLLAGYVVNAPAYLAVSALAAWGTRAVKDVATVKLLAGIVLYPLGWLVAGWLVARGIVAMPETFARMPDAPLAAGITTAVFGATGGAVLVRYLELARETLRAAQVRLTRRRRRDAIARLLAERATLCDAILAMAEGLDLPGQVEASGRVV